jgi:hypothetical protein
MTDRRNEAAGKLLYILPKYFYSLEKDDNVDKEDKEQIRQLQAYLKIRKCTSYRSFIIQIIVFRICLVQIFQPFDSVTYRTFYEFKSCNRIKHNQQHSESSKSKDSN